MPHQAAPAFTHALGCERARIVAVGEAWGKTENLFKVPLVGASGAEFARLCAEAGITEPFPDKTVYPYTPSYAISALDLLNWWGKQSDLLLTNVFAFRPDNNNIELLCGKKAEVGANYPFAPLKQGKYFLPEYFPERDRLREELETVRPNLVLALGNVACWALLNRTNISAIRGAVTYSTLISGLKVLPTFHPAAVLRDWSLRVIVLADLLKAAREREFPEIRLPERFILVDPSLDDMRKWFALPATRYAVDIETCSKQITSIGFARSRSDAIVVPFVNLEGAPYWPTPELELAAWRLVQRALESPVPKIFHNGLYDLQYIYRMGIRPRNCAEDTMLLHHSLYPEMRKSLGFLGSIYSNEAAWKLMRKDETLKRDE